MADVSETSSTSSPRPQLHKYSCLSCHKRKVKCDRLEPCGYCARHDDECVYQDPDPPRKRKRPVDGTDELRARLQRYEMQLRQSGATINENGDVLTPPSRVQNIVPVRNDPRFKTLVPTPSPAASSPGTAPTSSGSTLADALRDASRVVPLTRPQQSYDGRLIADRGRTRYLENHLWVSLDDELHNARQILQNDTLSSGVGHDRTADEGANFDAAHMLLSTGNLSDRSLEELFPSAAQSGILWQLYLDNVHPLCKILHAPTFQQIVDAAKGSLQSIAKSELALLFAVYTFAISTTTNTECERKFGHTKLGLLKRLQLGTRQSLVNASFLRSSDIVTLQAFVHFLLCMRTIYDAQTLWTLSGVAFRIAQRIGLHRDDPSSLTPFECELRRRLWRQLMILDHTSSELAGSAPTYTIMMGTLQSKLPLYVNDSDLFPEMTELPPERDGACEMIFCALRYHFSSFFTSITKVNLTSFDSYWNGMTSKDTTLAEKDKAIDALNKEIEERILRFCDPLVPLHNLTSIAARAALAGMRLRAHHPRQYSDNGVNLPQSEKDMLFSLSLKIMQYDSLVYSNKSLQRYHWHVKVYFQWHALIYLLSELRYRKTSEEADRAWDQIVETFRYHPEIIHENEYALYIAIRSLALRAWEVRETESRRQGTPIHPPEVITKLRNLRAAAPNNQPGFSDMDPIAMSMSIENENTARNQKALPYSQTWPSADRVNNGTATPDANLFLPDMSPPDWDAWDSLLRSMDLPGVDTSFESIFK